MRRQLYEAAKKAGVVHAVTFNYRGNPLVQQAREMIAGGELGRVHFVHGGYLQDWLLQDTDFSWRLEPEKGGRTSAVGDIGSHWCDLVQHVIGQKIVEVLADFTTVIGTRLKPSASTEAFAAASDAARESFSVSSEDLASILVHFDGGAKGALSVGQVCAGHKNDLWFEVSGRQASLRWLQERQNELWIGRRDGANGTLLKDPSLLGPPARAYAHLPGGHQEAWADAFCNVMRDVYGFIAARKPPTDPRPPPLPHSRTATNPPASSTPSWPATPAAACGRRSNPHDHSDAPETVRADVPPVFRLGVLVRDDGDLARSDAAFFR